jgi:hypothetical protein
MLMAIDASELLIVTGCFMAISTYIPLALMFSGVDWKILCVMIPG